MDGMLQQFRCPVCKKLLMRYRSSGSLLLVGKCPRCHKLTTLSIVVKS